MGSVKEHGRSVLGRVVQFVTTFRYPREDLVWPSVLFASQVQDRRAAHGLDTKIITSSTAGHRVHLPGEPTPGPEVMTMQRGGTAEADAELGSRVWPALLNLMKLE